VRQDRSLLLLDEGRDDALGPCCLGRAQADVGHDAPLEGGEGGKGLMEGDDLGPEDRQIPRIQFNRCQPRSQVRWAFCDDLQEGGQGRFLVQDGSWTTSAMCSDRASFGAARAGCVHVLSLLGRHGHVLSVRALARVRRLNSGWWKAARERTAGTRSDAAFRVHVRRSSAGLTHRMIVAVAVHIFFQDVKPA
jgi:hypothetical protein